MDKGQSTLLIKRNIILEIEQQTNQYAYIKNKYFMCSYRYKDIKTPFKWSNMNT